MVGHVLTLVMENTNANVKNISMAKTASIVRKVLYDGHVIET